MKKGYKIKHNIKEDACFFLVSNWTRTNTVIIQSFYFEKNARFHCYASTGLWKPKKISLVG